MPSVEPFKVPFSENPAIMQALQATASQEPRGRLMKVLGIVATTGIMTVLVAIMVRRIATPRSM